MIRTFASLNELIRHLATAIANAGLYSIQHPQVERLTDLSLAILTEALETEVELSLMVIDADLIIDGKQLDGSLYTSRFVKALKSNGITHLKFLQGIGRDDILALVDLLVRQNRVAAESGSIPHVQLGTAEIRFSSTEQPTETTTKEAIDIADLAAEEAARFAEIYEEVRKHRRLRVHGIIELVNGFVRAFQQVSDPLMALAPLRALDEYTFTHSTNVCVLNLAQATALGIDGDLLQDIGIAAMLHDIGKLFIPQEILTKPGSLDEQEWQLMRQHPVKGAQYLLDAPGVPKLAVVTAFEHHLKFDLSGYPTVSAGWQQNLCSHMTSISDVFDALRTKRSYEGPVAVDAIVPIMQGLIGTALHPGLTKNFLKIVEKMGSEQRAGAAGQGEPS